SSATVAPKLWPTPCSINAQPRASVRVSATLVVALLNMHGSPSRQRSASAVPVLLLTQAIVKTLKKIWRLKLAPIFVRYWRRNGRCLVKEAAMWLLSILRASAKRDDMIKTRGKADRVAQKTPARSKVRRRPAPRPESEPVDPRRMDDDPVVQGILTAISQKRLKPGTKLGEDRLARALGTTRIHIRQALAHLASRKIVVQFPNRGAFVYRPTWEEAREMFA